MAMGGAVVPTVVEVAATLPGDELVAPADVVMDRAFSLDAAPEVVWPWLVQLGKARAGWYLPHSIERWLPPSRRAIRHLDERWQGLRVGDVIPDWGGANASFEVASIDPSRSLVYRSSRGRVEFTWSICLKRLVPERTRVVLRLRMSPVRHRRLAGSVGAAFDELTVAGMAAGLRERLAETAPG